MGCPECKRGIGTEFRKGGEIRASPRFAAGVAAERFHGAYALGYDLAVYCGGNRPVEDAAQVIDFTLAAGGRRFPTGAQDAILPHKGQGRNQRRRAAAQSRQ